MDVQPQIEQVDEDRLLTTNEVAQQELRCHPRTLNAWRHQGRGPAYVNVGRRIFYRLGDVRAWLRLQTVGGKR